MQHWKANILREERRFGKNIRERRQFNQIIAGGKHTEAYKKAYRKWRKKAMDAKKARECSGKSCNLKRCTPCSTDKLCRIVQKGPNCSMAASLQLLRFIPDIYNTLSDANRRYLESDLDKACYKLPVKVRHEYDKLFQNVYREVYNNLSGTLREQYNYLQGTTERNRNAAAYLLERYNYLEGTSELTGTIWGEERQRANSELLLAAFLKSNGIPVSVQLDPLYTTLRPQIETIRLGSLPGRPSNGVSSVAITYGPYQSPEKIIIGGVSDDDKTLYIWELPLNNLSFSQFKYGNVRSIANYRLTYLKGFVTGAGNKIQIYDCGINPTDTKCIKTLEGHHGSVTSVATYCEDRNPNTPIEYYDPDQKMYIVSGSDDKTIKIWKVQDSFKFPDKPLVCECIKTLEGHHGSVTSVAIIEKRAWDYRIVSGSDDKTIKIWDFKKKRSEGYVISFSGGECIRTLKGHHGRVTSVTLIKRNIIPRKFSKTKPPAPNLIVSGSDDKTIKIWNMETGECMKTLEGHHGSVTSVTVYKQEKSNLIVSGSDDKTMKIWCMKTGKCILTLANHSKVKAVATYDTKIVCGSNDGSVTIWEIPYTGWDCGTESGDVDDEEKQIKWFVDKIKQGGYRQQLDYDRRSRWIVFGPCQFKPRVPFSEGLRLIARIAVLSGAVGGMINIYRDPTNKLPSLDYNIDYNSHMRHEISFTVCDDSIILRNSWGVEGLHTIRLGEYNRLSELYDYIGEFSLLIPPDGWIQRDGKKAMDAKKKKAEKKNVVYRTFVKGFENQGNTAHCALYALNNALGSNVFTVEDFMSVRRKTDWWGDFEIETLISAESQYKRLKGLKYDYRMFNTGYWNEDTLKLMERETFLGFVVNKNKNHYVAIAYDHPKTYTLLDSLNGKPSVIQNNKMLIDILEGSVHAFFVHDDEEFKKLKKDIKRIRRKQTEKRKEQAKRTMGLHDSN